MTPALPVLFTQIALARPQLATNAGIDANLTGWRSVCETMFDGIVNEQGRAKQTRGGLLYVSVFFLGFVRGEASRGRGREGGLTSRSFFLFVFCRLSTMETLTQRV